jgi:hypothetical protein
LEAEIRRVQFEASPGKYFKRAYIENTKYKKVLAEWFKC